MADFLITPFVDTASDLVFTRVGSVYPDRVKIVARYPLLNDTENGHIHVVYRQLDSPGSNETWKEGPVMNFTKESDWVDTVTLRGLWPGSSYECELPVFCIFIFDWLGNRYIACIKRHPYYPRYSVSHFPRSSPSDRTPFPLYGVLVLNAQFPV